MNEGQQIKLPNGHSTPAEAISKTDGATDLLRDRIIDLSLEPGYNIDEKKLLVEFGIGRTPLREALNRLISEGLIEARGTRGLRVTPLDLTNTRELFEAYIISERMVASILRFDDPGIVEDLEEIQTAYESVTASLDILNVTAHNAAFHRRLAEATQNSFVKQYSWQLSNLARRISFFIFRDEQRRGPHFEPESTPLFGRAIEEHWKIILSIKTGDRSALVNEMTTHAQYFQERLSNLMTRSMGQEIDFVDFVPG